MTRGWAVGAALLLAGCATANPIPEGYRGATATIWDSLDHQSDPGVNIYFLAEINGKAVENAYTRTVEVNTGRGLSMEPQNYHRAVPAQAMTIKLEATTHYAAPIVGIFNIGNNYLISGKMSFAPAPGHNYRVVGELGPHHCVVWLEDLGTDTQVGRKFETNSCWSPA